MSRQNPIQSGALLLQLEHIAAVAIAERRARDEKLGHDLGFRAVKAAPPIHFLLDVQPRTAIS